MHSVTELPEGYREIFRVDLQKDKKKALLVNLCGTVIMLLMAFLMSFRVPISTLFSMEDGVVADFKADFLTDDIDFFEAFGSFGPFAQDFLYLKMGAQGDGVLIPAGGEGHHRAFGGGVDGIDDFL